MPRCWYHTWAWCVCCLWTWGNLVSVQESLSPGVYSAGRLWVFHSSLAVAVSSMGRVPASKGGGPRSLGTLSFTSYYSTNQDMYANDRPSVLNLESTEKPSLPAPEPASFFSPLPDLLSFNVALCIICWSFWPLGCELLEDRDRTCLSYS